MLDSLIDDGQIKLEHNTIYVRAKGDLAFELEPAYRFLRTADNGPDPHDLVGEIRSDTEIREMKAEVYLESLIYNDTAYEIETGFIGEKKDLMDKLSDTELLTKFILETLL